MSAKDVELFVGGSVEVVCGRMGEKEECMNYIINTGNVHHIF